MGATLAEIIRARRMVRGMERQHLAEAVGCDVRTVRRWESGSRPLTRHLPALREALGIPMQEMDRIILSMLRDGDGALRIEGPEFLEARGLSHEWLAETLLAMDRRLIDTHPALGVHDPDQWAPVFQALPATWRVLTHRGQIVGNSHFLPLLPGVHAQMRAGRLRDADIRLDHLSTLDLPGECDLHITALVMEPAYRQGRGLVMLLRALFEQLFQLAERDIFFATAGATAWTPQAELLCHRLGMRPVSKVTNERGIFFEARMVDLPDSLGLPEISRLVALYRGRSGGDAAAGPGAGSP